MSLRPFRDLSDPRKTFAVFFPDGSVVWTGEATSAADVAEALALDDQIYFDPEDLAQMAIHELSPGEAAQLSAWIHEGQKPSDWPLDWRPEPGAR